MRETSFVNRNHKKWSNIEKEMHRDNTDPDKLKKLFVEVTDDLSYSRTFYPNRSVRVYLNALAQRLFQKVYRNERSSSFKKFVNFWVDGLPRIVWEERIIFLLSAGLFWGGFIIGIVSSIYEPDFAKIILGSEYVDMTLTNIKSGDPMAVYKQRSEFDMFFGITLNNIRVDLMTFIFGAFASIGSVWIMIQNGVLFGTFQWFFVEQGIFRESFLTIWLHGTLEMSTVIISGAAGIVLGRGLLFPGTYSRIQAFLLSAKKGLLILFGVIPITIMAGFIEGFVTRLTDLPDIVRLLIILVSLFFLIAYFIVLPIYKRIRGDFNIAKAEDDKVPAWSQEPINFKALNSVGELFTNSFVYYRRHIGGILGFSILAATIYGLGLYYLLPEVLLLELQFNQWVWVDPSTWFVHFQNVAQFFNYTEDGFWPLALLNIGVFSLVATAALTWLSNERKRYYGEPPVGFAYAFMRFPLVAIIMAAFHAPLFVFPHWLGIMYVLTFFMSVMLFIWLVFARTANPFTALYTATELSFKHIMKLSGLYMLLMLIIFLFSFISDSAFSYMFMQIITAFIGIPEAAIKVASIVLLAGSMMFTLCMSYPLMLAAVGLFEATTHQINTAEELRSRVENIQIRKRVYGMDRERSTAS